jgi:HEPN domain-containing protein
MARTRKTTITLPSKRYADQLYAGAIEQYLAYVVITEDPLVRHDFLAVKHGLLCQALELALKSLLVDTGNYNEEGLIVSFGHDLEKVAQEVKRLYDPIPELDACMGWIQILNPDYKSRGYLYPMNNGSFKGTNHEQFAKAVEAMVHLAARSIHSYKYPDTPLPASHFSRKLEHL